MRNVAAMLRVFSVPPPVEASVVFVAVLATTVLGVSLTHGITRPAPIWPANAIVLAMLLRCPWHQRPFFLAIGFLGNAFGDWLHWHQPVTIALSLCNTIDVSLGAFLFFRSLGRTSLIDMSRFNVFGRFVICCGVIGPGVAAMLAAIILSSFEGAEFWLILRGWFAASSLGILTITPLLLSTTGAEIVRLLRRDRIIETLLILALNVLAVMIVFFEKSGAALIFPAVIVTTFRLGFAGATIASLLIGTLSMALTFGGYGPFAITPESDVAHQIWRFQGLFSSVVVTALTLATVLTERNRVRQHIERMTMLHRLILESTDYAVIATRLDGIITLFNGAAERMLGYSATEVIGLETPLIFYDLQEVNLHVATGVLDTRGVDFTDLVANIAHRSEEREWTYRRRNGSRVPVLLSITAMRNGGSAVVGYLVIAKDLSERKSTEQRLQRIVDAAPNGMLLVDHQGSITLANAAAERMFGYPPGELLNRAVEILVPTQFASAHSGYREAFTGHSKVRALGEGREFCGLRLDGDEIPLEIGLNTIDTPDGAQTVTSIIDISARKSIEAELKTAKEDAEQANRAKSDFLAAMSHEIRSPLNGIIGFADLLEDTELSPDQRRKVRLLKDAGSSLLHIINDILDLSKIDAGKVDLEHLPLNLASVADGAMSIVRPQAVARRLDLHLVAPPGLPAWVLGDAARLRQILLNLLSNAVKFTDRGSVTLSLDATRMGDGWRVRFAVTDTGIGIAPEHQNLLFQHFSQIVRSTHRRYGGTGLGLAIARRLVEAMGGEIGVNSIPDQGSTFWFALHLEETTAPRQVAKSDDAELGGSGLKILVAEDLYMNQVLVDEMLTAAGHEVTIVRTGSEAIDAVQLADFDVVLMDVEMPGLDGIAAAEAIRELDDPARAIPIIALSANAMTEEIARCKAAGMNAHLAKPVDRSQLLRAVTHWAHAKSAWHEPSSHGPKIVSEPVLRDLENRLGHGQIELFVRIFHEQLTKVLTMVRGDDRLAIAREAHALVSLAGNFGLSELSAESRKLVYGIHRGRKDLSRLKENLEAAAERARSAIDLRYA